MLDKLTKDTKRFYGEIMVSVSLDTALKEEKFQSLFDEDCLRARIVLESGDGEIHSADVLAVIEAKWTNFDDL